MNNNKKSSVDCLYQQICSSDWQSIPAQEKLNIFAQIKKMYNEEHEDTWNNAIDAVEKDKWDSFEQYYNEKFKGGK